jgi:hypothetical protein
MLAVPVVDGGDIPADDRLAWKTPRRSGRSTMAWPAIVSTTDPAMTSAVSIRPVQGVRSLAPGQWFHQNGAMATAGSEKRRQRPECEQRCFGAAGAQGEGEEHCCGEQHAARAEAGLRGEALAL